MSGEHVASTLDGSPYSVSASAAERMAEDLHRLQERVALLRARGRLSPETLRRYFGAKRFEQVAESNAIEGSTLTVGETQLAILKGVTITGADPKFVRDAVSLDAALIHLVEMARRPEPTSISDVKEFHELLFSGIPGAGMFRKDPVRISGSDHRPPRTWGEVMSAMEQWMAWSRERAGADPLLRATVLHAWLVHVHPFLDGNGRTARAITNLELIRVGYPSVILRKTQDRARYISALRLSDEAGDLSEFVDLMVERFLGALVGLESAARELEGYDVDQERIREGQRRRLAVWNKAVELLAQVLADRLAEKLDPLGGQVRLRPFSDALGLEEYLELCRGQSITRSWAFRIEVKVPGTPAVERLAWIGYRSQALREAAGARDLYVPTLFWSKPNPGGYPPWIQAGDTAPGLSELSIDPARGDEWHARTIDGAYRVLSTTQAADALVSGFLRLVE